MTFVINLHHQRRWHVVRRDAVFVLPSYDPLNYRIRFAPNLMVRAKKHFNREKKNSVKSFSWKPANEFDKEKNLFHSFRLWKSHWIPNWICSAFLPRSHRKFFLLFTLKLCVAIRHQVFMRSEILSLEKNRQNFFFPARWCGGGKAYMVSTFDVIRSEMKNCFHSPNFP